MKTEEISEFTILKLYAAYHEISFYPTVADDYFYFCASITCDKCKIQETCKGKFHTSPIIIHSSKIEEFKETYPEYFI